MCFNNYIQADFMDSRHYFNFDFVVNSSVNITRSLTTYKTSRFHILKTIIFIMVINSLLQFLNVYFFFCGLL